jgi:integrase/recombinase XerD
MAKNAPINPTHYKFTPKEGQLGKLFLAFEKERAYTGVSANTCELYESSWKFYASVLEPLELVFRVGKKPMTAEQRKAEERRLIQALKERRNARIDEGNIEGVTLNTYLRNLRTFINWLRLEDQGPFLLFDWTEALNGLVSTETKKPRVIWTQDQIETFRKFKPGPNKFNQWRVWTIGMLMLDNGLRIDEALSLKVPEVDLDNEQTDIWNGKGGKYRRVPVDTAAMYLAKYKIKWIDPYRTTEDPDWFFFGTHDGRKMSQRNALRDLMVVLKQAGIVQRNPVSKTWTPELSWHNFRHTTLTVRLEQGESLDKVQRLAGHAKPTTTQLYLHVSDNYLKVDHVKFSPLNRRKK